MSGSRTVDRQEPINAVDDSEIDALVRQEQELTELRGERQRSAQDMESKLCARETITEFITRNTNPIEGTITKISRHHHTDTVTLTVQGENINFEEQHKLGSNSLSRLLLSHGYMNQQSLENFAEIQ